MVDSIGSKPVSPGDRQIAAVARTTAVAAADTVARGADNNAAEPQLTAVTRQMAATPPVDTDRVARIRKAISDGTFPIYPAQIADRLIALKFDWDPTS